MGYDQGAARLRRPGTMSAWRRRAVWARAACHSRAGRIEGVASANQVSETRASATYLGHRNIQHTVRYTELSPRASRTFGVTDDQWGAMGLVHFSEPRSCKRCAPNAAPKIVDHESRKPRSGGCQSRHRFLKRMGRSEWDGPPSVSTFRLSRRFSITSTVASRDRRRVQRHDFADEKVMRWNAGRLICARRSTSQPGCRARRSTRQGRGTRV
jgi:hypothetical protein